MIYTVTLNPCFDTELYVDSLEADVIRANDEYTQARGKGVNVSIALKNLGVQSKALILVGQENSAKYEDELSKEIDDIRLFSTVGAIRENLTITDKQKQIKINRKGSTVNLEDLRALFNFLLSSLNSEDYVVISGSLPKGINLNEFEQLCISCSKASKLVLDVSGLNLDIINRINPWMIKPNIHELNEILNAEAKTIQDIISLAKQKFNSKIICVSSADGAVCITDNEIYNCNAPKVEVKSTVSSGDSFIAGFLYKYIQNELLDNCLKYAVAFGSATAKLKGTDIADKLQVDALFID